MRQQDTYAAGGTTRNRVFSRGRGLLTVISALPVLLVSYLCCHYVRAELLLGLFLVEWIVVLAAWRSLCPKLGGHRSAVLAAVPFLLSFCVAALVTRENMSVYMAVWTGSDDWWYLQEAGRVVDTLRSSGWNLIEAWSELTSVWIGAAWTLAGWPFLLGLISSLVPSENTPAVLHAIALSLNATFLTLILALIFHVFEEPARRFPWRALLCFLFMSGDPLVYAAMSLKESMLLLSLMLLFVACVKLSRRIQIQWIIWGLLGMAGVVTSRLVYMPLVLLGFYWLAVGRTRLSMVLKVIIGLVLIASLAGLLHNFSIREVTIADVVSGRKLAAETGIAMTIYNIPVVGPVLYYAISPVPPLPWKILSQEQVITTLIRGAGSTAWFFAACYVLFGIAKNRRLLKDRLFVSAAIMFLGIFIAAVLYADDPRYKQPTNFYLSIMLFLTWYNWSIRHPVVVVRRSNDSKNASDILCRHPQGQSFSVESLCSDVRRC